jgi:hypothetical protein
MKKQEVFVGENEKVGEVLLNFQKKNPHYEIIISTTLVNYRGLFFFFFLGCFTCCCRVPYKV